MSTTKSTMYTTHGYHESVLRSHKSRTAANSVAYLLPSIQPSMHILDVGCGPGTITADLATLVPDGKVTGMDISPTVVEVATASAQDKASNCTFVVGSATRIPFPDSTFDVTHAHQVLQHLADPVGALREMRRVTKPGGLVASRESDCEGFVWHPPSAGLTRWRDSYLALTRGVGAEPNAGRQTHVWAKRAGFKREDIRMSTSTSSWTSREEVVWWAKMWRDRCLQSEFAQTAKEKLGMSDEELQGIAQAWLDWGENEDAWFTILNGEMLCAVDK